MLDYQPQLDVSGQRAIGVEALIRWQKPAGELIPPSDFIALAEELGLISDWAFAPPVRHWRAGASAACSS